VHADEVPEEAAN